MPANINRRQFLELCGMSSLVLMIEILKQQKNKPNLYLLNPPNNQPNILILILDTLSAMDMSLYGHYNNTTPWLNELASKSIIYHNHYSPGNFTSPATASLLTGVNPWTHRCFHGHGSVLDKFRNQNLFQLASRTHTTITGTQNILANILLNQFREHIHRPIDPNRFAISGHFLANSFPKDYTTALWSETLAFSWIRKMPASLFYSLLFKVDNYKSLLRDSEKYGDLFPRGIPNNYEGMTLTLEHALNVTADLLAAQQSPYLGYFHYWPPHSPYNPTKEFVGIFDSQKQPIQKPAHFFSDGSSDDRLLIQRKHYNEFIANADADIGKQIKKWQDAGLLSNTILIITSDHGEMNERGIQGHSTRVLYNPLIKIPLMIMLPGQQTRIDIYENTNSIDILPTIMNWTGQSVPDWAEGEILPPFRDPPSVTARNLYALEAQLNSKWERLQKYTAVLIKENYKYILYEGYDGYTEQSELFDLNADPEELTDLSTQFPGIASDMKYELEARINESDRSSSG